MSCNWLIIRVWLLAVILVASLAGTPAFAQVNVVVRVEPSTSSVPLNNAANISIKVDNVANLSAIELHLSFNPGVLEVTGMTNGGFVAADFTAQNVFDNTAGTIDYAVAQMNRAPAQGNGTLLNIVFRTKADGSSTVTTRPTQAAPSGLLLSDQNGMAIQASWMAGTINVGGSQPTAITPTFTLSSIPNTPINTSTPITNTPTKTFTPTPITNTPTSTSIPANTPTATQTYTPVPPAPGQPGTLGTHVVRFGEWLYCIGRAYGVSPWAIAEQNHLWWPYIIFPNQKLTIPNVPWMIMTSGPVCKAQFSTSTPTPTPTPVSTTPVVTITPPTATPIPATTATPTACRATYVVRRGDTLYGIALRYGTTYTELARVNGISNPRLIYSGQWLCIP